MKVGNRILWQHRKKSERRYSVQVNLGTVKELSPSGMYVCLEASDYPVPVEGFGTFYEKMWFPVADVRVLEVLEKEKE